MTSPLDMTLDEAASEAAVLRLYRQIFAVLAREAGAMIVDTGLIDVDEAILEAFAEAGSDGLTLAEATAACPRHDRATIERRFGVLRDYRAITKVVDRKNVQQYRAAFAPYVMLLFLRRLTERGGQSELHQLLTLEQLNVTKADAVAADGHASVSRMTKIFRLLANELASLVQRGAAEALRENAQLLWGNRSLIVQAEEVHATVLGRWPELGQECALLRIALAAYGDAIESAAGRLLEQAGTTRALGLLPAESWLSFARGAEPDALAAVLDGFVFDAPAPWFSAEALAEAVESARQAGGTRLRPPRPEGLEDPDAPEPGEPAVGDMVPADDKAELAAAAERMLGGNGRVSVAEVLGEAGDWPTSQRLLAEMIAIHHHPDLGFELTWADGLRIGTGRAPAWASAGWLTRTGER
ncbi:MAG TPA: hypothetical protein VGM53_29850 [Streptosporangiaceae bacterium]|jgi:hypothetical protein